MTNVLLNQARRNKADEFYTQLPDIEAELRHYTEHFRDKVVLCNCDDPYESNFFKYFALNFNRLGLKKLITTSYAGSSVTGTQLHLLDQAPEPDERKPYKVEITQVEDYNRDGAVDLADVEYLLKNGNNTLTLLEGDGDFRSAECLALLRQADIVVTNPPFSLFREYVAQLVEHDKKFVIIGSMNAVTYKEIFPLIKDNKMWLGQGFRGGNAYFYCPTADQRDWAQGVYNPEEKLVKFRNVGWFTNLDIAKRHQPLTLYAQYHPEKYPTYANYDAIEVSKVADIPYNYDGPMGVPITFLDKHSPEQFEITGITKTWFGGASLVFPMQIQVNKDGSTSTVSKLNDGPALEISKPPTNAIYYKVDEKLYRQAYARILVKRVGGQP